GRRLRDNCVQQTDGNRYPRRHGRDTYWHQGTVNSPSLQLQYVVVNPSYPNPFPSGETVASQPPSTVQLAPDVVIPWMLQYSSWRCACVSERLVRGSLHRVRVDHLDAAFLDDGARDGDFVAHLADEQRLRGLVFVQAGGDVQIPAGVENTDRIARLRAR